MRGHVAKKGKRYDVVLDVGTDERGKRKQKWVSGFATKAEAERKLTETLASLDQGTYVEPNKFSLERYLTPRPRSCRRRTSRAVNLARARAEADTTSCNERRSENLRLMRAELDRRGERELAAVLART